MSQSFYVKWHTQSTKKSKSNVKHSVTKFFTGENAGLQKLALQWTAPMTEKVQEHFSLAEDGVVRGCPEMALLKFENPRMT
jgi:hypothetical protein